MRAIVDTNLYQIAFFPHSTQPKQRTTYKELHRRFTLLHNVVSLVELTRYRRLKSTIRSEVHKLLASAERVLLPDLKDWKISSYMISELQDQNRQMTIITLRKMQMDALIASIAIRHNLTLISEDLDFDLISRTPSGKKQRVFRPAA